MEPRGEHHIYLYICTSCAHPATGGEETTKGPRRRTSTPGGHDLWRGWLITMRPYRIHKQISQILIQLSRLMAAGLWRRCGASDLSQGAEREEAKEAEEPLPAPTLSSSPRENTITAGISVAIGIVIILFILFLGGGGGGGGKGRYRSWAHEKESWIRPNVSTTESLIYSRSTGPLLIEATFVNGELKFCWRL